VAIELIRTKGADKKLAEHLEELAVKTGDHDALIVAHELLAREVQGEDRGNELVRQAEIRVKAGMPRADAISHGEGGLPFIPPVDAEPLLERLSQLAAKPIDVIDLYERQVTRSKAPTDRVRALSRAAQVASMRGQPERARGFFELALTGAPGDDTLGVLESAARDGDKLSGGDRLRRALCQALSAGGHGARDGGRTRANLLRRAAMIAHRDLHDIEQAFTWLGDALVAHVDSLTLDMLESLGIDGGDPRRAEAALSHALGEVFDGPLVKQLLGRRAKIRREQLVEPVNAAADLKKLHDLSPQDQSVMDELAGLLMELNDYKSLVQLYEDQILRGKDMNARAELARKVARIWEEQLADGREAADAWRRVMRMRAADPEATQGLERSKSGALKKPEGDPKVVYAPPKLVSEQPVAPPARAKVEASIPPNDRAGSPSNGPKRPSSPRISVAPRSGVAGNEATSTRTAPTTQIDTARSSGSGAPSSKSSRSAPPPLPSSGPKDMGFSGLTATMTSPAKTRASREDGGALESEIDASLDRLELEGPTGTTLPGELPRTVKGDDVPSTLDAPAGGARGTRPPVTFNTGEEATRSAHVVPHTVRESFRVGRDPLATERPITAGESGLVDSLHPAPATVPPLTAEGGPTTSPEHSANDIPTGESAVAHEELGSGELIDDEHTGVGMPIEQALESTLARGKHHTEEDEIVIADDLAEDVDDDKSQPTLADDEEEHTDAGATVPPFRSGS
jgi:hypothetical protein